MSVVFFADVCVVACLGTELTLMLPPGCCFGGIDGTDAVVFDCLQAAGSGGAGGGTELLPHATVCTTYYVYSTHQASKDICRHCS